MQEGPGKVPGFLLGRDDPIVGNPVEDIESEERSADTIVEAEDDDLGAGLLRAVDDLGQQVSGAVVDMDDTVIELRREQAENNKRLFNDGTGTADSVWAGTVWSRERNRTAALREDNARWSEFAAAKLGPRLAPRPLDDRRSMRSWRVQSASERESRPSRAYRSWSEYQPFTPSLAAGLRRTK